MKINKVDNNTNLKGVKMNNESKKIVSMADEIKSVLTTLFKRAEREVPENMTFSPVQEVIKDVEKKFQVDEFFVKIIADPVDVRNSRRVILGAYVPNTDYSASVTLTKGPKDSVLKEISAEGFVSEVAGLLKQVEDAAIHSDIR